MLTASNFDKASVTRILFENFPSFAIGLFYAVGIAAIAVFAWGVHIQIRKYRRGRPVASRCGCKRKSTASASTASGAP